MKTKWTLMFCPSVFSMAVCFLEPNRENQSQLFTIHLEFHYTFLKALDIQVEGITVNLELCMEIFWNLVRSSSIPVYRWNKKNKPEMTRFLMMQSFVMMFFRMFFQCFRLMCLFKLEMPLVSWLQWGQFRVLRRIFGFAAFSRLSASTVNKINSI